MVKKTLILLTIVTFASITMFAPHTAHAQGQTVVYVDGQDGLANPTGPNPGNSWTNAYKYLQNGLTRAEALASTSTTIQVWVRGASDGSIVYYPDRSAAAPSGSGLRDATFALRNNVEVFGGFVGGVNGEANKNERNHLVNITILSGAIGQATVTDNSWHVVSALATGQTTINDSARLDGFTIRDGYAINADQLIGGDGDSDDAGAGLALVGGPGSQANFCQPVISRCRFTANTAQRGGAVYMRLGEQNLPQFRNCTFDVNDAASGGGAMFIDDSGGQTTGSRPLIINSLFHHNTTDTDGAAIFSAAFNTPRIINSTFTLNHSDGDGAALSHAMSQEGPTRTGEFNLDNDIIYNNSRIVGGQPVTDLGAQLDGAAAVDYSCVQALASPYSGTGNITSNPQFVVTASNFHLGSASPCIDAGLSSEISGQNDTGDLNQNGSQGDTGPDLDNRTRIVGAYDPQTQDCRLVDMGCYEFASTGCTADIAPTPAGDGLVNIDDLLAVVGVWGPCPSAPTACPGDISPTPCGDGEVDIDDLLAVISAWGECPGPTAGSGEVGDIPEEFWDCYDVCSQRPNFGDCMEDCFKALCELGHTEYCE